MTCRTRRHDGRLRPSRHAPGAEVEPTIDLDAAERRSRDLLVALGHDPTSEHLPTRPGGSPRPTPSCSPREPFDLTTFPNDEGYDELVLARDIPFHSLCQHHLLPFTGVAHVGYLPGERILGLSKLARVVELSPAACRCRSA